MTYCMRQTLNQKLTPQVAQLNETTECNETRKMQSRTKN